jgi:hypothetical protein
MGGAWERKEDIFTLGLQEYPSSNACWKAVSARKNGH